jgi:hypothetical protein
MNPISFHDREVPYTSPDPEIKDLPVLPVTYGDGTKGLVSCWKPKFWDILRIILGKPIYLVILGTLQPPVVLLTDRSEVMGKPDEQKPDLEWDGMNEIQQVIK